MAAMPWPLASKPEAAGRAGGAGDLEGTVAADAASASVKVARRIASSGSRHISRSNRIISRGTSNISDGSRNSSTSGISPHISHSSPHSIQEFEVHHSFFQVWSAWAFSVRVPRSTPYTEHASS